VARGSRSAPTVKLAPGTVSPMTTARTSCKLEKVSPIMSEANQTPMTAMTSNVTNAQDWRARFVRPAAKDVASSVVAAELGSPEEVVCVEVVIRQAPEPWCCEQSK